MSDNSKVFFCYQCNKVFNLPPNSGNQGPIKCDSCHGEFIEQLYLNQESNQASHNIGINNSNNQNSSLNNSAYYLNGRPINPNSSAYNAFRNFFGPNGNFNLSFNRNLNQNPHPNLNSNPNSNQNPNPNQNQNPSNQHPQRMNLNNPYANFGRNQNLNNLCNYY